MNGIIYVLSNPSMPGIVKVGKTNNDDPQTRIDTLYNTSVPVPFECEIAVRVEDESHLETAIFEILDDCRVNPRREFFRIHPDRLKPLLTLVGLEDVTPEINSENEDIDAQSRAAGEKLAKWRPRLNFEEMGIPVEAELVFVRTGELAQVIAPRRVRFRDEEMTLTRATKMALNTETALAPRPYWAYEGRGLSAIYDETYTLEE